MGGGWRLGKEETFEAGKRKGSKKRDNLKNNNNK